MLLYFNADVSAARVRGFLWATALLFGGWFAPDGWAGEFAAHDEARKVAQDKTVSVLEDRKASAEALKANLDQAKTSEEKRALVEAFRVQNEALRQQREISQGEQKSPKERLAEMKAKAANDPVMLARIGEMEARLASVERIQKKQAAAEKAEGEEKVKLTEEIRQEQKKQADAQRLAMAARMREAQLHRETPVKNLTPEMAALKVKSDARRAEMDQLRESMKTAPPQERAKLLEEWRKKREEEMAAMRSKTEVK